jgi:hypothetical protein
LDNIFVEFHTLHFTIPGLVWSSTTPR